MENIYQSTKIIDTVIRNSHYWLGYILHFLNITQASGSLKI